MREWLETAFAAFSISLEMEDYCLGRGLREERVRDLGIVMWDSRRISTNAPDRIFREGAPDELGRFRGGHGSRGQRLDGRLCVPILSPPGHVIGFEARAWQGEKRVTQYLLPDAAWNPVFLGLTPRTMRRIWEGGSAWVTEGLFDMGAMEHVVPESDAVLATLRARVSDAHAIFFGRHCRNWVNLVYDNDETGRRQTLGYVDAATGKRRWGAIDVLGRVGVKVRDVPYRGGKDPGEVWERRGTMGLRQAFGGDL